MSTSDTAKDESAAVSDSARKVAVSAADLPLHCPLSRSPLWARHPRVFLDVLKTGEVMCPYCSTIYYYTGEKPTGHH
jgi:uncharacterized Zn-finger protein